MSRLMTFEKNFYQEHPKVTARSQVSLEEFWEMLSTVFSLIKTSVYCTILLHI